MIYLIDPIKLLHTLVIPVAIDVTVFSIFFPVFAKNLLKSNPCTRTADDKYLVCQRVDNMSKCTPST